MRGSLYVCYSNPMSAHTILSLLALAGGAWGLIRSIKNIRDARKGDHR